MGNSSRIRMPWKPNRGIAGIVRRAVDGAWIDGRDAVATSLIETQGIDVGGVPHGGDRVACH